MRTSESAWGGMVAHGRSRRFAPQSDDHVRLAITTKRGRHTTTFSRRQAWRDWHGAWPKSMCLSSFVGDAAIVGAWPFHNAWLSPSRSVRPRSQRLTTPQLCMFLFGRFPPPLGVVCALRDLSWLAPLASQATPLGTLRAAQAEVSSVQMLLMGRAHSGGAMAIVSSLATWIAALSAGDSDLCTTDVAKASETWCKVW